MSSNYVIHFCEAILPQFHNHFKYLTSSRNGCINCYEALRHCDAPIRPPQWWLGLHNTPLTYPKDADEILRTWEERASLWQYQGVGRVQSCRKYKGHICIDEYSHEGNVQSRQFNKLLICCRSNAWLGWIPIRGQWGVQAFVRARCHGWLFLQISKQSLCPTKRILRAPGGRKVVFLSQRVKQCTTMYQWILLRCIVPLETYIRRLLL